MFGNLKKQLGEATDLKKFAAPQNLANSLMGSRQRSGGHTPSTAVNAGHRTLSQLSLTSNSQHDNNNTTSQLTVNNSSSTTTSGTSIQSSGGITPRQTFSHSPLSPASSRSHSRQPSITSPPLSPGMSPTPPVDTNNVINSSLQITSKEQVNSNYILCYEY